MKNLPFYLIILLIFMALSNELWSEGMFIDGLYYATIARNLSEGIGSLWFLHFTETSFNIFHEHPPLAIGQVVFILWNSICERIYSTDFIF